MSKTLRNSILLLLVVLLGYWCLSPYIVLYQIKTAVEKGDSEKVSHYIDFDSLKLSLKQQIVNMTMQYFAKNNLDSRMAEAFKSQIAQESKLNQMLDQTVSPSGIQTLLAIKQQQDALSPNPPSSRAEHPAQHSPDYSTAYQSLNWFAIKFKNQKFQDHTLVIKMQRDGLSWKVKQAELVAEE